MKMRMNRWFFLISSFNECFKQKQKQNDSVLCVVESLVESSEQLGRFSDFFFYFFIFILIRSVFFFESNQIEVLKYSVIIS